MNKINGHYSISAPLYGPAGVGITFLILSAVFAIAPSAKAQSVTIRDFNVNSSPLGITMGPDNNVWFTGIAVQSGQAGPFTQLGVIGRLSGDGTVAQFSIPTPNCLPHGITMGPDGNLWFTEIQANKIGRITTAGAITEFVLPTADSQPHDITAGPDGNLWFTEINADKIGRITTDGLVTEFLLPTAGQQAGSGGSETGLPVTSVTQPYVITVGPDRNLWFTEANANKIGRITPQGVITEFSIPTSDSQPHGIVAGPDHNLWFAEYAGNKIGVMSVKGVLVFEVPVPTQNGGLHAVTVSPDRKVWFTELSANKVGSVSLSDDHRVTEYSIASSASFGAANLYGITGSQPVFPHSEESLFHSQPSKHDDHEEKSLVWFVELSEGKIGEVELQDQR